MNQINVRVIIRFTDPRNPFTLLQQASAYHPLFRTPQSHTNWDRHVSLSVLYIPKYSVAIRRNVGRHSVTPRLLDSEFPQVVALVLTKLVLCTLGRCRQRSTTV